MAESEEELKSFLMKVKEESEKVCLKFNIQKSKIMASNLITSWQIDGETKKKGIDYFLGLQNRCRWETFCLEKSYDWPRQHIKKQKQYFAKKIHLVNAKIFPVVMHGCESWTINKPECWTIWCFWTVVLEKILESPLDSKEMQPVNPKGNQS